MEVALSRPRAGDEYKQALADCLEIVRRTQAIVDHLLTLERLDSDKLRFIPRSFT
jgi:hypothetical protein